MVLKYWQCTVECGTVYFIPIQPLAKSPVVMLKSLIFSNISPLPLPHGPNQVSILPEILSANWKTGLYGGRLKY